MDKKIPELINKYLQREISDKEFQTLSEWIYRSESNKSSFEESLVSYKKSVVSRYAVSDILKKSNRRRRLLVIGASAAAVVLVGLFFSAVSVFNEKTIAEPFIAQKQIVLEGERKGVVLTTSGKSIELVKVAGTILPSGVAVTDSAIDYSKKEAATITPLTVEQSSIYVPKGERFQITLSDGTKLWMNADTKVDYPSAFVDSCRRIRVSGEVFLEVMHDKNRPFIVEVYDAEIKVLGTKFNISAYPEEDEIKTTLMEGSVSFQTDEMSTILVPNEQITINKNSSQYNVKHVEAERFCQWMDDIYHFNDVPLYDLAKLFNRVYAVEVIIQNDHSMNKRFTGTILKNIPYQEMFETIIKTTTLDYEIKEGKIIIW